MPLSIVQVMLTELVPRIWEVELSCVGQRARTAGHRDIEESIKEWDTYGAGARPLVRRRRVRVRADGGPRAVDELVDVEERALEAEVVLRSNISLPLSLPPCSSRDVP